MEWNNGITTEKFAYIQNLQGDIVGIIDSNGTEVVKYTYDAWGKILSTTGSLAATLGTIQPFRYRGYVYDVETGLYYLRSRYYMPIRDRFLNADTLLRGNMFAYCNGNPIILSDKTGYSSYWYDEEDVSFDDQPYIPKMRSTPKSTIPYDSLHEGGYYIITPLDDTAAVHEDNDCFSETVATAYKLNNVTRKKMEYVGMYIGGGFYLYCDNAVGYSEEHAWDVTAYSDEAHFMLGVETLRFNPNHSHSPSKYVENLQRKLCSAVYPIAITGIMNEETYNAVRFFQSARGMSRIDGVVGDSTKEMLFPMCTQ